MEVDLEILYSILADVARRKDQIVYSDLSQVYYELTGNWHEPHGSWDDPLGELNRLLHGLRWPPLSSAVIDKETREPGGKYWGDSPNVPGRPMDEIARIALYAQLLGKVHDADWPRSIPTAPPPSD